MAGGAAVGIVANPASGKDVRRLVGAASVVDNNEKVNVVRRLFAGLAATGVQRVHYMPEHFDIVGRALDGLRLEIDAQPIEMGFEGRPRDTVVAAERLVALGVSCLVSLGGDGTARLVGSRSGQTPIVALSTGTNNALPSWIDGTVAGIAAGLVATGRVDLESCAPQAKRLDVRVVDRDRAVDDLALVDLAVSRERFVAARAIWEPDQLADLFLTRAEPGVIGLSAIGAHLAPTGRADAHGLWLRLGTGGSRVRAAIAPGLVRDVALREWRRLEPEQEIELRPGGGVVALDGEKEHELSPDAVVSVRLTRLGPRVVEIRHTIEQAARAGAFVLEQGGSDGRQADP
jgi:predicted polyphosphate/ATP-dependent NAD kinase